MDRILRAGQFLRIKTDAHNQHIRLLVENKTVMNTARSQVRDKAKLFRGKNKEETFYNIWKYLKNSIKYVADDVKNQNVKTPSRLVKEKTGDCKSYSLFTAAVLLELGYKPSWRYASVSKFDPPHHIFVVSDGYIIDAVHNSFNRQNPVYSVYGKEYKLIFKDKEVKA